MRDFRSSSIKNRLEAGICWIQWVETCLDSVV